MFSKIDKKILIVAIICFVAVLIIAVFAYKAARTPNIQIENSVGGINTQGSEENNPENNQPGIQIEAEGKNNIGSLSVCEIKCGDGTCQKKEDCNSGGVCICAENTDDCPEDCK